MGISFNDIDAKMQRSTVPRRNFKMKKTLKLETVAFNFDIPQQELMFLKWQAKPELSDVYCLSHTPTLILATKVLQLSARRRCDTCSQFELFHVKLDGKTVGTRVVRREK